MATLIVKNNVYEEILKHSMESFPIEACGYIAGNNNILTTVFRLTNVDKSHEHFSFDPKEQFEAYRKARNLGLKILAVYHSHPYSQARMSNEDIRLAYDESVYYAIFSVKDNELRIFKIENGKPIEVDYSIEY